jgi:mediator of RNA polymerase II transcription subunit 10
LLRIQHDLEPQLTCSEAQIQDIVQDLYDLMVQTNAYDNIGPNIRSRDVLTDTMYAAPLFLPSANLTPPSTHLSHTLGTLHTTTSSLSPVLPDQLPHIPLPPELLEYVDSGRNPDIYTREFVENFRRTNQIAKGKLEAFGAFRDVLAKEMISAMPELKEDVKRVVKETGGTVEEERN